MKISDFCKCIATLIPIFLVIAYLCGIFSITYKVCMTVGISTVLFALGNVLERLPKNKKQAKEKEEKI